MFVAQPDDHYEWGNRQKEMTQKPFTAYEHLQAEVITRAILEPRKLLEYLDGLIHEAYLAGWNNQEAGKEYHPSELENAGETQVRANLWCKHKGTRP